MYGTQKRLIDAYDLLSERVYAALDVDIFYGVHFFIFCFLLHTLLIDCELEQLKTKKKRIVELQIVKMIDTLLNNTISNNPNIFFDLKCLNLVFFFFFWYFSFNSHKFVWIFGRRISINWCDIFRRNNLFFLVDVGFLKNTSSHN